MISIKGMKHDFAKSFSVKQEINAYIVILLFSEVWIAIFLNFMNCEKMILFPVKRELDPPLPPPVWNTVKPHV